MSQKSQAPQVKTKQQTTKPSQPKIQLKQQQMPLKAFLNQATLDPKLLTPADASQLQRSIGNQGVNQLGNRTNLRQKRHTPSTAVSLQRMLATRGIQAKLAINAPGDQYEQEADTVAKQVVSTINTLNVQKPTTQRQEDDEQIMTKPMIQRVENGNGGLVNDQVERDIQQARGHGQPLADNVRSSMEQAFGTDFSGVKIHTDSQSDQLNQAVQAKAFTTGQDIFFRQGTYEPGNQEGQALIAHELTHVIQQGGGPPVPRQGVLNRFFIQRNGVQKGQTDPLTDLANPKAKGLLYGMSTTRKETSKRLMIQDAKNDGLKGLNRYRTIDEYNREIGLNAIMENKGITGIFLFREALMAPDLIGDWRKRFPAANPNLEKDEDLTAWIRKLKANDYQIGLYDLGLPEGSRDDYKEARKRRVAKIASKNRFEKNFTDKKQAKSTKITKDDILMWLKADRMYADAVDIVNDEKFITPDMKQDLEKWVHTAFWRRTSKLGIDFTTERGHTIHFNTAGDSRWNPSKGGMPKMRPGDLKKIKNKYGRLITTSEYKHASKGIKSGMIPAHLVNFYDEF